LKAWRRRSTAGPQAVAIDCGEQPGEVDLQGVGANVLDLFWDWPFGAASVVIEEASSAAPDTWVVVSGATNAADDFFEWASSFAFPLSVHARIRRLGSDETCAVVSGFVELGEPG
jgi:hypothetical protein